MENDTELDHRFKHHVPQNDETIAQHGAVRGRAFGFASFIQEACPPSRERSLALTKIEEAMFWANASIARAPNVFIG